MNIEKKFIEIVSKEALERSNVVLRNFQADFSSDGFSEEVLEDIQAFCLTFEELTCVTTTPGRLTLSIETHDKKEALEITNTIDGFLKSL